MILAGCILAPDLSEFDALHSHKFFPCSQSTHPAANPSMQRGYFCRMCGLSQVCGFVTMNH